MVDNAPILRCQHAGLTIEGYSRAAVQTYWRIPELKIGFDLGAQPWDFMGTPTWFVTHTHLDHVAALPVYVARRRMMRMEPPTLYVPAPLAVTTNPNCDASPLLISDCPPSEVVSAYRPSATAKACTNVFFCSPLGVNVAAQNDDHSRHPCGCRTGHSRR